MSALTDDAGEPIFAEEFLHATHNYNGVSLDVIETTGNLWLAGPAVMEAMGFRPHPSGGHGARLRRISAPDIIKVLDTPFRFSDGRRNKGILISPRAVMQFADGKTQNFNPIMATAFVEWMNEYLLKDGKTADGFSPYVKHKVGLEPVFHKIIRIADENEAGEPLDPLRPSGEYYGLHSFGPLRHDEIEIDHPIEKPLTPAPEGVEDGEVIDDDDRF